MNHETANEAEPPNTHCVFLEEEDQTRIERAVRHINLLVARKSLEVAVELGTYLLDTFFSGDPGAFHRGRNTHTSFRALATHPELAVSHTHLYCAVAVVEQLRELPDSTGMSLSFSHHKKLLPIKDVETRTRLISEAEDEGWSVRDLDEKVKALLVTEKSPPRRGRPRTPVVANCAAEVHRVLKQLDALESPSPACFGRLSPNQVVDITNEALRDIQELQHHFRRLRARARARTQR